MFNVQIAIDKQADEDLMRLVAREGNTRAFDELYRRYGKRLHYYFFKMLGGDKEKSQDFLQDVFVKLIEKPELFNPDRRFSTWLFSVAYNMCKNEYRRMAVRQGECSTEADLFPCEAIGAGGRIDHGRFMEALNAELDSLDDIHKTVFLLRYKEEFSIREIGETLNCPEGTVKSRLHYAIRKLAHRLRAYKP